MYSNTNKTPLLIKSDLNRLRFLGLSQPLVGFTILWLLYMVSDFRSPMQAITLSDGNSNAALRQLVFAGTGAFALLHLYKAQSIGSVLVSRLPYILFACLIIVSSLWSDDTTLTLKRSSIFAFGIIAQITLVHSSQEPVSFMIKTVVYFCIAAAGLSLLFHVALPAENTVNPARPGLAGISNHPNSLAPFLSIGLLLSLGFNYVSKFELLVLRVGQVILGIALVLTGSVTSWATTIVCIGLYIFLATTTYKRGVIQIVILAVSIVIFAIGWQNVKSSLFDAAGRDESLSGRDELWQIVWHKASEEPLIGHGFGAFWTEGKGRELVQTWNPRQSHNAYLDVFVDLGIIGLAITILLFPLSLLATFSKQSGHQGSSQRRACAAMMSVAIGYILTYALSQSYLLRFDSFPFFTLAWVTLLFTNTDSNRIEREFS